MAVVMYTLSAETFFPTWSFLLLGGIAMIVLFVGGLGGRGAVVSFRTLQHGDHNHWLIALTCLMGLLLCAELVMAIWGVVSFGVVSSESAQNQSDGLTETTPQMAITSSAHRRSPMRQVNAISQWL